MDVLDRINKQMQYAEYLKDEAWQEKRKTILRRDLHTCRNCGNQENLHVHHRQYHAHKQSGEWKKPWEYKEKYLITLCGRCHSAGHAKYSIPTKSI